jgi:ubiquinone/menaquinone biosynthesis C-methylase UbiE
MFKLPKKVLYVKPNTSNTLKLEDDRLIDVITGELVGKIVHRIPRFIDINNNYAESFGWQWKKWENNQSESRGSNLKQSNLLKERTRFDEFDLDGKIILECGMGGGDDTEVLVQWPFAEIHSFDLSTAVERAAKYLNDGRLFISQASIYSIPYPDRVFDFVFCHRVLQHTPNPEMALRSICKKVKGGGILFVHSYKRSKRHMQEWRYKYRWLTKRLPKSVIYAYVKVFGRLLHKVVHSFHSRGGLLREIAYQYIPFYRVGKSRVYLEKSISETIELEQMITFDALTPVYDSPMSTETMKKILHEEGFEILHLEDSLVSPVYATARKI